ncbi:MAG: hypothetical protein MR332_13430 [Fusicatenibacter sp.]|nr:hypothetical protein [Fusicatenibacter sp.]
MSSCCKCGKTLTPNEISAHKKFINRGASEFLCRECLANRLDVDPAFIDRKIEQFKKQGCTLFI